MSADSEDKFTCRNHPDRFTATTCMDCLARVCEECRIVLGPKYLCLDCRQKFVQSVPELTPDEALKMRARGLETIPKELVGVDGWLLWFCIVLSVFVPISTIPDAWGYYQLSSSLDESFGALRFMSIIANSLGLILVLFSWYCAYLLGFVKQDAVPTTKIFLIALAAHSVYRIVVARFYNSAVLEIDPEATDMLVSPLSYLRGVYFSGVWYAYLSKSERVRATYRA